MSTPSRPLTRLLALASALLVVVALPATTAPATSASRWAPAAKATITPGVQMFTKGAQCTGNFVFTDRRDRVYVGYAAHCAGRGAATDTNGCDTRSVPLGTRVRFASGADLAQPGTTHGFGRLAYSSWITMRRAGERRQRLCNYNDFALVRVGRAHERKVNPSVPFWGGPTGVDWDGVAAGSDIYSYGSSSLRPTELLSPKIGASLGQSNRGWNHDVYTVTPGVPGDSGSGFMGPDGRAFGTLSTVAVAPLPASNGVGDLARELRYAMNRSGIAGLRLVRGTVKFDPAL